MEFMKSKSGLEITFLTLLISTTLIVNGMDYCILQGIDNDATFVEIRNIPEVTTQGTIIWSSASENIISAAVTASPFVKYVQGLRYTSRYEYQASEVFSNFITVERTNVILREVTFFCGNNESRNINFTFHLVDENNCPPEYFGDITDEEFYRFSIRKSSPDEDSIVLISRTEIQVKDLDFLEENADLKSSSSHLVFTTEPIKVSENPYIYNISLSIDMSLARLGQYNFQILVTDGKFTRSRSVVVDVLP